MDRRTKIHPDAIRILKKGTDEQLGWAYTLDGYFDYFAEPKDDSISIYIVWGDDQPGDMYALDDWDEVRRDLERIISLVRTTNKLSD